MCNFTPLNYWTVCVQNWIEHYKVSKSVLFYINLEERKSSEDMSGSKSQLRKVLPPNLSVLSEFLSPSMHCVSGVNVPVSASCESVFPVDVIKTPQTSVIHPQHKRTRQTERQSYRASVAQNREVWWKEEEKTGETAAHCNWFCSFQTNTQKSYTGLVDPDSPMLIFSEFTVFAYKLFM